MKEYIMPCKEFSAFFAVDRCYLFHFSADGRTIGRTCQWQSAGAVPLLLPGTQNILVENMPWWARQIKSGGHVLVSDVNKLPPEAVIERELCLSRNICSFLHVPIHSKGQLIGFLGLDTARPQKNWPLAHLIHSGIVTEMLTNTLVRRQAEEAIQHLSFNDQLTGLYNRRFFEKELRVLDSAANLPLTLVIADVNGLKLTNDVFGHPTGDQLLQKAAGIIQKECRADDIIARIGGDEFAILLPKTSYEQAGLIVRRINRAIAAQQTGPLNLSISFGWATKQEAGEDITAIFKKADDSMYKSKLSESILTQHETIVTVINKLYEKNEREQEHSQRVSQICGDIGVALGLSRDDLNELRMAGLLHDLGKVTVGNCILDKPGPHH
ncbi:MAG: diguanylate cyclase [Candidatus Syntrophopropionicum ammoniitolerans]